MFDKGFFGGLFEFNGDGKLDAFEKAADTGLFLQMTEDFEKEEKKYYSQDEDYDEDYEDEYEDEDDEFDDDYDEEDYEW